LEHLNLLFNAVGEQYAARKKLGLLLVTSARVVLYSTERANKLLSSGPLVVRDDTLAAVDAGDQATLTELFYNQIEKPAGAGQSSSVTDAVDMLAGRDSGFPLLVSIVPVAASESMGDAERRFAVILRSPKYAEKADVTRLMDTFGLTEREAQLALHLATGGRLSEFSEQRHLAMNTVKTHLKQVFKKVGVNSQLSVAITMVSALR